MDYYAMITPGRAGDWGDVILVDARVADFVGRLETVYEYSEEEIDELKSEYTDEVWAFLKSEFKATDKSDVEFISEQEDKWDENMSDNYYTFEELASTHKFGTIKKLIDKVIKDNLTVLGDLS